MARGRTKVLVMCVVSLLVLALQLPVSAKTTIQFVHWYGADNTLNPAIEEYIAAFEAAHPDIDIEPTYVSFGDFPQKVLVQVVAGVSPDLSLVSGMWFGDFARTGIFIPVDEFLNKSSVKMSDFYPGSAEQAKYNGKYLALPFAGGPQRALWFYESALLERGLNPNTPPNTWDALRAAAPRLVVDRDGDGVPERYAVNTSTFLDVWAVANGAEILSEDGTCLLWDSEPYVEAMEFIRYLHVERFSNSFSLADFKNGKGAMYIGGSWLRDEFEAHSSDLRMTYHPVNSEKGRFYHSADMIAVYHSTPEKEAAAWAFVEFLVSPKTQAQWAMRTGFAPMNMRAVRLSEYLNFAKEHPAQWVASEMMERLYPYPPIPDAANIRAIENQWISRIMNGSVAPRIGLQSAVQLANARLKELLSKQ